MTAHELIASIFSRAQHGAASSVHRITRPQLDLLSRLVREDKECGAMQLGRGLSFVWMPRGREKYVITEDPSGGDRHTLARLANVVTDANGMLF